MGGYKRGQGKLFYHVSCGKLKLSTGKKDENGDPVYEDFDGYEGQLVGIEKFEDEYEKKKQKKIRVTMQSEVKVKGGETELETAEITFTDETFFVPAFFSRLVNVEIDKPFLLGVLPSEQNEKMTFCFMKQYGKKIEKDKTFPQPEKIGDSKYDFRDVTKRVNSLIAEIQEYLNAGKEPAADEGKDGF